MKVAVICDVLGEKNNGTTIAALNLIEYLQSQGDEVHVVCCDKTKKGTDGYFILKKVVFLPLLNHYLKRNCVELSIPSKKVIRKALEGVEVCHLLLPFLASRKSLKICKDLGIPTTAAFHFQAENLTSHIFLKNSKKANLLVYKNCYKHVFSKVDDIHYPTQFIKDVFEKSVHHEVKGRVISNGVNSLYKKMEIEKPEEFKETFNILYTSRYSKEKMHHLLLEAVAKSKYKDQIQLILAGKGPRDKFIIKKSKKLGIREPILRFFTRDELLTAINSCDLYVHSAEVEIESIGCLEAISCGLVPIINDSPKSATKNFALDSNNLFKYNDSTDLAKKIDFWIENPSLKDEYSKKYLGYANKFEQNECMRQTRQMILDASLKNEVKNDLL